MITSYKQLTGKYLKANLRRTILTIIGIVLSVALISSIGFFFEGMQEAQLETMKNNYGSFHLMYKSPDPALVSKIQNNPKVSKSGVVNIGETIPLTDSVQLMKYSASGQGLELMPFGLRKGRYPQSANEAALEEWTLRYVDQKLKIGDTFTLQGKEYTLVGIVQDQMQSQLKGRGILLTQDNTLKNDSLLLVEISPKTNMNKALDELKTLAPKSTITENAYVLVVLGVGEARENLVGLYVVVNIIIGIVVIATIAVIYNSFQISVVERVKQFGLLRTIGSTPKQIRKLVFREASVLALIAIPLGLLFGIIAILVINLLFTLLVEDSAALLKTSITPTVLVTSVALGIVSIFASAYLPALFAGRISPLVAISSRALISKEKIKRRKSLIFGRLFGFEGELASKNIKRNKKRYRITVFSITISVVLFVTFASFIDMSLNLSDNVNESRKIHFSIIRSQGDDTSPIEDSVIQQIKSIHTIKQTFNVYQPTSFTATMDQQHNIPEMQEIEGLYSTVAKHGAEKTQLSATINIYDEPSLELAKKYIQSGSIDLDKLNQENGVILIRTNHMRNPATDKTYVGPVADLKVGDTIELQKAQSTENSSTSQAKKVKIMAIVHDDPFHFRGNQFGLKLITSETLGSELLGVKELKPINLNILLNDEKDEEVTKTLIQEVLDQTPNLRIVNLIQSNRQTNSLILLIKFLLYGFVVVISCISCVNIVNTLTTNIILRKREFATIKAIGITQKGLRKMVILEGLLYGIQGSIYGALIASFFSYQIHRGIASARETLWRIPWSPILIATLVALAIGYIAVLSPLARIKKENLIDVVREDY